MGSCSIHFRCPAIHRDILAWQIRAMPMSVICDQSYFSQRGCSVLDISTHLNFILPFWKIQLTNIPLSPFSCFSLYYRFFLLLCSLTALHFFFAGFCLISTEFSIPYFILSSSFGVMKDEWLPSFHIWNHGRWMMFETEVFDCHLIEK